MRFIDIAWILDYEKAGLASAHSGWFTIAVAGRQLFYKNLLDNAVSRSHLGLHLKMLVAYWLLTGRDLNIDSQTERRS
jgi:hypothetical protein